VYNWNLETLEKMQQLLIDLRKMGKKTLSKKDLLRIEYSIDSYQNLLSFFDDSIQDDNIEDEIDDKTFVARFFNNIHNSINRDIINTTIKVTNIFEKPSIAYNLDDSEFLDIPLNDVIEMTRDIFSSFKDDSIMEIVNNILDPNSHLLHVSDEDHLISLGAEYSGYSDRDYYNNIGYVLLFKNGKIRDLYTLVHEIFHIIVKKRNLPSYIIDDNFFLSEVEGSFSDLIVSDYLYEKGIYKKDAKKTDILNYDNTRNFIRSIYVSHNFYNYINSNNEFDIERINEKLDDRGFCYSVKKICMRDSLISFNRDLNYSFSYLVALDLFYNHKNGDLNIIKKLRDISKLDCDILKKFKFYGVTFNRDDFKNLRHYQKNYIKEKK